MQASDSSRETLTSYRTSYAKHPAWDLALCLASVISFVEAVSRQVEDCAAPLSKAKLEGGRTL